MDKRNQELKSNRRHPLGFLAGVLIGGLAGAGAMLLLAPQSGKRTRASIQRTGIELRDQASDSLDDAVAQVRIKARQITSDISNKAEELQQRGHEMIDEQKERLAAFRGDGKKALQGAHG